jgi:hypothetical protein
MKAGGDANSAQTQVRIVRPTVLWTSLDVHCAPAHQWFDCLSSVRCDFYLVSSFRMIVGVVALTGARA